MLMGFCKRLFAKWWRFDAEARFVPDCITLLIMIALITLVMIVGDATVFSWPESVPRVYWALLDPIVQTILTLLIVSPLFTHPKFSGRLTSLLIITVLVTVLLDLDHFVVARSFKLSDALKLSGRPGGHSLLFALASAFVARLLIGYRAGGWLILIALLSHIVRDASHGGVPLFWPLPTDDFFLSYPAYIATEISLCLLAALLAGWPYRPVFYRLRQAGLSRLRALAAQIGR
jgi:hypothetical protein